MITRYANPPRASDREQIYRLRDAAELVNYCGQLVVTQFKKKRALSVPENTGRRGLYKTVICWWHMIL
jgi:hypothetical protein